MARAVLVVGVSRHLGGRLARRLAADPGTERVIGVDVVPPPHDLGGAEFVRADVRTPAVGRLLARTGVDTVVHAGVIAAGGGRGAAKEINVLGSMQLLAACQKTPSVRRLIVKSTSAVYGASARDAALLTEDTTGKVLPRGGWGKDSLEVEGYVRGFSRRRPDVDVLMLRFANIIGPQIRTAVTDYFSLPVLPTVWGFDPRLQFVHEDDAVEALRLAALAPEPGPDTAPGSAVVVNVAGPGVLTLSQAARLAGRPTMPVPVQLTGALAPALRRAGLVDLSADLLRQLAFGRGLDTARMGSVLHLTPRYTTRAAFEDFVGATRSER